MMTLLFSYYIFFREQKIVHSKIIEKMEKNRNYRYKRLQRLIYGTKNRKRGEKGHKKTGKLKNFQQITPIPLESFYPLDYNESTEVVESG